MNAISAHPLRAALALFGTVFVATVAVLNGLPQLFEDTLPWLAERVAVLGLSVGEFLALAVAVVCLLLLACIAVNTRPKPQSDKKKRYQKQLTTYQAHIDTLLTWVYRRKNWGPGLSTDARYREGAPAFYGSEVYKVLGISEPYSVRQDVRPEPGFDGPPTAAAVVPVLDVAREINALIYAGNELKRLVPRGPSADIDWDVSFDAINTWIAQVDEFVDRTRPDKILAFRDLIERNQGRNTDWSEAGLRDLQEALLAATDGFLRDLLANPRLFHEVAGVGGTHINCTCGWTGPGNAFEEHKREAS